MTNQAPFVVSNDPHPHPFGMILNGRDWRVEGIYRYGFNTQELDLEIYGNANLNSAEFWEYDLRLGKRWNRDPFIVSAISPYAVFFNNPILLVDHNGDKVGYSADSKKEERKTKRLVRKAAKRDPEFAKIHQDRLDDPNNTYIYDWEKSNSGSVNTKDPTSVRSGQDPTTENKMPNRFYIEFGTIDPKYDVYSYREVVDYYIPIWVQPYSQKSWNESIVAYEIAPSDFDYWRQNVIETNGVSAQPQVVKNNNIINVTLTLSWVSNESLGSHLYTIQYLGMSVPLYVKVPRTFLWRHDWNSAQYRYSIKASDKVRTTRNPIYNVVGGNADWYKSGGAY